ncbi:MAG: hypothetical protein JF615_00905 [Asticcacaulis sp.]|nr:hypothetical protein [Asticcacaulis sp.]
MVYSWGLVCRILGFVICPYALARGGTAERLGAAIYLVSWALSRLFEQQGGHGQGIVVFAIDVAVMVLYVGLSLTWRKGWILFAAAFQLNTVLSHITWWLFPQVGVVAYVTALGIFGGYGLLFAIMAGVIGVERERWRDWRAKRNLPKQAV